MYPEYRKKLAMLTPPIRTARSRSLHSAARRLPRSSPPAETSKRSRCKGTSICWLAPAAISRLQIGDQGVVVVDTGTADIADKVLAALRKLSDKPIQYVVNTSFRADRTGGNDAIRSRRHQHGANVAGNLTKACEVPKSSRRRMF